MKMELDNASQQRWTMPHSRLWAGEGDAHHIKSWAAAPAIHNGIGSKVRGMDITWVTGRIAVGGGIWNEENMAAVMRAGVTHIIDMQLEFDDTEIAKPFDIEVLWNPAHDDFRPKPGEVFERGVEFAVKALDGDRAAAADPLRGRSTPGADDDVGNPRDHGLEAGRCERPD